MMKRREYERPRRQLRWQEVEVVVEGVGEEVGA